jgi:ABC-type amino acid transport substrate-binding protein
MRLARFFRKGNAKGRSAEDQSSVHSPMFPPRLVFWLVVIAILAVVAGLVSRKVLAGRDPTWDRIQQNDVWRVGLDPSFPPFENLDGATQQPVGLDVDLTNAIASRLGIRAEIVGVGFDELIDAVTAHRVDSAISALPVLEYRTKEVSFSAPYVEAGILLVAPRENAITKSADLAGRRLAAEWGSASDAQARALQRELGGNLTLVLRESSELALQAVLAGEADAAAVDAVSLALFDAGKDRLITVGEPLQSAPYVIVVPANAPKLLRAINETLAALEADGTLAQIRARWLVRDE